MSVVDSYARLTKRRPARKSARVDAELVFRTFVRALGRLREPPRAGAVVPREKA
jgi:hypothetical protein